MKISARNQLPGTVISVTEGAVNGVVRIDVGGEVVTADITMAAIDSLGLAPGKRAWAVVKATNVMFAAGDARIAQISARNQLPGTVVAVQRGAVNAHMTIELANGARVMGSITNAAVDDLGLAPGRRALAIVKSTDVMVGVDA